MKITVLDGLTLNPGDLDWGGLESLGDVTVHDRTAHDRSIILKRIMDVPVILTNKTPIDREVIEALDNLKYIGVLATGYNVVDVEAAAQRGIPVTNIPSYGTDSVAQMAFAHILNFCHNVQKHSDVVKSGAWAKSDDFCFWNSPLMELTGKTIGIIGFGRIGRRIGELAHAFGMKVIAYDIDTFETPDFPGFQWVELEDLLKNSDFVSLNSPLTNENKGLINAKSLRQMKPTAFLVNMARGPLVVEDDLAEALEKGIIAGAGIDTLEKEPPQSGSSLFAIPNITVTPHIAWATREARSRLLNTAVDNVRAFMAGKSINVVNGV